MKQNTKRLPKGVTEETAKEVNAANMLTVNVPESKDTKGAQNKPKEDATKKEESGKALRATDILESCAISLCLENTSILELFFRFGFDALKKSGFITSQSNRKQTAKKAVDMLLNTKAKIDSYNSIARYLTKADAKLKNEETKEENKTAQKAIKRNTNNICKKNGKETYLKDRAQIYINRGFSEADADKYALEDYELLTRI